MVNKLSLTWARRGIPLFPELIEYIIDKLRAEAIAAVTSIQRITRSFHPRMLLRFDKDQLYNLHLDHPPDSAMATRRNLASARNYAEWDRRLQDEGWPSEGNRWRVWL